MHVSELVYNVLQLQNIPKVVPCRQAISPMTTYVMKQSFNIMIIQSLLTTEANTTQEQIPLIFNVSLRKGERYKNEKYCCGYCKY